MQNFAKQKWLCNFSCRSMTIGCCITYRCILQYMVTFPFKLCKSVLVCFELALFTIIRFTLASTFWNKKNTPVKWISGNQTLSSLLLLCSNVVLKLRFKLKQSTWRIITKLDLKLLSYITPSNQSAFFIGKYISVNFI